MAVGHIESTRRYLNPLPPMMPLAARPNAPQKSKKLRANRQQFHTKISKGGADLVWPGEVQAMKFGTRFAMPRRVMLLQKFDEQSFCATFDNGQHARAKSVVVATGVQ